MLFPISGVIPEVYEFFTVLPNTSFKKVEGPGRGFRHIDVHIEFQLLVGTGLILMLNWWVVNRNPLLPKDINNLFRTLILPNVAKWE